MVTWVLVVMVGTTVQIMQTVGWIPVTPIAGLRLPYWSGVWFGLYPTWEGILLQLTAFLFVIGSYFAAEAVRKRRRNRSFARTTALAEPPARDRLLAPPRDPAVGNAVCHGVTDARASQRGDARARDVAAAAAASGRGPAGRLAASARRFLDVQAGSVWNDLRGELGSARGVVLDIGCGAQPLRELLPPGVTYIGIDIAESQERFGYRTPDTRYFEGNVWPVEDASVDLAFATETLEHVDDPPQFLVGGLPVLRPGGRLVLTVPFSARYHFVPYDYWRYTPASLDMLLRGAGLTDVEVFARGNAVTVAALQGHGADPAAPAAAVRQRGAALRPARRGRRRLAAPPRPRCGRQRLLRATAATTASATPCSRSSRPASAPPGNGCPIRGLTRNRAAPRLLDDEPDECLGLARGVLGGLARGPVASTKPARSGPRRSGPITVPGPR